MAAGAFINVDFGEGSLTILDIAVTYGHVHLIRYLVQNGYTSPTKSHLYYAAASQMCMTSLKCLAELGEDISLSLRSHIINQYSDSEALNILQDPAMRLDLSHADDCDSSTNRATGLLTACMSRTQLRTENRESFRQLVISLIESGADINYYIRYAYHRMGYLLECALTIGNDDGSVVEELINRGAQVQRPSGKPSLIDMYLGTMIVESHLHNDLKPTRSDDSCVAVYKLELLLKHGAGIWLFSKTMDNYPIHLLEYIYMITTGHFKPQEPSPPHLLSLMKLLVNNGVSRDPVSNYFDHHNPFHSFLFRALTDGYYDIARSLSNEVVHASPLWIV